MADVTLAEAGGNVWLVDGEPYLDELLANLLPPTVSIEIVACADQQDVQALRERLGSTCEAWAIHPGIVRRIKNVLGPRSVMFSPWSAMMDGAAQDAIAAAAAWLESHAAVSLTLRQFALAAPMPGSADLQRLRGQLVAGALERAGVAPDRILLETIPAEADADADRLALITGDAPSGAPQVI